VSWEKKEGLVKAIKAMLERRPGRIETVLLRAVRWAADTRTAAPADATAGGDLEVHHF